MFIRFDYRCPCGRREERFVRKSEMDSQFCTRAGCMKRRMDRLPAAPKTTFRFADRRLKP